MLVLVTGANGYLGRGIVKQLLDDGNAVVATDFSCENVDPRAIKKPCDLFSLEEPISFFGHPDVVLHLAWRNGFVHNSETHVVDLSKHYFFLKKLIKGGIKRLAVMGTMHEVGPFEGPIDEMTPCRPQNLYGIAKNSLRDICFWLCKESGTVLQWLRAFYIVDNTSSGSSVFSKIVKAEEEGVSFFPFTNGLGKYDFLDYGPFCIRVAAAVEQDDVDGIINICSGVPQQLSERVERFIADNGFRIKLDYGKYPGRPYDSKSIWGNSKKIDRILNNRCSCEF